jgi:peptidoglycan hydrolase-like protein with peptidoglycan-binding domain
MLLRASSAIAIAAALSGCAYAYEPPMAVSGPDILSALPADAPPGECYARVRVPGGPIQGPPTLQGAQWVMAPGPPGAPGPIWCLVPTGPAPVAFEPDRYGFIRVLCEDDLTGARVSGIQRQLYQRGYYRGPFSGRYDAATAAAVAQFQSGANIAHGGYMSFETVQALEGGYVQQGYAGYASAGYAPYQGSPCLSACMPAPPPPPPCLPCAPVYIPPPPPPPPMPLPCPQLCGQVGYSGTVAFPAQPYAQAYAPQGYVQQGYTQGYSGGIGYSLDGGVGYGYAPGYAGGAYYSSSSYYPPMPAYAAAAASARASARVGGVSASARASASSSVRNGWLTWGGR